MSIRDRNFSVSSTESASGQSVSSESSMKSRDTTVTIPDPDPAQGQPLSPLAPHNPAKPLPCEFAIYGECDWLFYLSREDAWIDHIVSQHLQGNLPPKVDCWFCDCDTFDAKEAGVDRRTNYRRRMLHIREHIREGFTVNNMRPDFHFDDHVRRARLVTEEASNVVRRYSETLLIPGMLRFDELPPTSALVRPQPGSGSKEKNKDKGKAPVRQIDMNPRLPDQRKQQQPGDSGKSSKRRPLAVHQD
ncbi:hypothetical protein GGR50DRAFT_168838 [Xylaria sp. CBS 124048]|nr:hypothetical protein GGR50DRAFT_168838 [Xylaria sp. CBS 124048]